MTKKIIFTTILLAIILLLTSNTSTQEEAFVYNSLNGLIVKEDVQQLNYKKSGDLTSIKAYRKSLQIKVKTTRPC